MGLTQVSLSTSTRQDQNSLSLHLCLRLCCVASENQALWRTNLSVWRGNWLNQLRLACLFANCINKIFAKYFGLWQASWSMQSSFVWTGSSVANKSKCWPSLEYTRQPEFTSQPEHTRQSVHAPTPVHEPIQEPIRAYGSSREHESI